MAEMIPDTLPASSTAGELGHHRRRVMLHWRRWASRLPPAPPRDAHPVAGRGSAPLPGKDTGGIERIGAEKVNEMWAATEFTGVTVINGREWLQKPGSVGKGFATEIRILDAQRSIAINRTARLRPYARAGRDPSLPPGSAPRLGQGHRRRPPASSARRSVRRSRHRGPWPRRRRSRARAGP